MSPISQAVNHLPDRILSALSGTSARAVLTVILTARLRILLSPLTTASMEPPDGASMFESDFVALALPYKFCFKSVHRHRLLLTGEAREPTGSESTNSDHGLNCSRLTFFFTGCMDLGKFLPVSCLYHLLSQSRKRVGSG